LKKFILVVIAVSLFSIAEAKSPLLLSNDAWPPFIIKGSEQGTAEMLVCRALERSGWPCRVEVKDWETVLNEARIGVIDGVAAAWRDPERETYLLFSEPYLTNRIVPVVNGKNPVAIQSIEDLAGLRVAMVNDYAYGDEIMTMASKFEVIQARNSRDAIKYVRNGKADTALVDELVARGQEYESPMGELVVIDVVLAFRGLHLAVSRHHPLAQVIIDDFQRAYKLMLEDGTVNEILDVDWLATDFGQSGQLDVVMRSGVSLDDLSNPSTDGSVYALEDSEYQIMRQRNFDSTRTNYQMEGKSYSSLQSAMDEVFGKDAVCKHNNFTSTLDCSDLFKKR
jgi:polar amino acid transport system substrate-binding protein